MADGFAGDGVLGAAFVGDVAGEFFVGKEGVPEFADAVFAEPVDVLGVEEGEALAAHVVCGWC